MATVNYSWNLPTVGGSEDTWGTSLNANWTDLDTLLGGVSQTEFAILDGATVSTAELNLLDGVTWTLTDYNTLTATATELNLLDGITALSGSDTEIVTGTAGTDGQIGKWNADGDLIGVGTNTANGDVVVLEDVSGSPGLPAVDGSQLTGVIAGIDFSNPDFTHTIGPNFPAVNSVTVVAHGLGGYPSYVRAVVECVVANNGFAIGQRFVLPSHYHYSDGGATLVYDATNLEFAVAPSYLVVVTIDGTNNGIIISNSANFKVILEAWA